MSKRQAANAMLPGSPQLEHMVIDPRNKESARCLLPLQPPALISMNYFISPESRFFRGKNPGLCPLRVGFALEFGSR